MRFRTALSALCTVCMLSLYGCSGSGTSNGYPNPATKVPVKASITGNIVDAGGQAVAAEVTLVSPVTLLDQNGVVITGPLTAANGVVSFSTKDTPATDVTVSVTARAFNYVVGTTSVKLLAGQATAYNFGITLVAMTDGTTLDGGVTLAQQAATATATGELTAKAIVPADAVTATIPVGAIVKDNNGPLTGNLSVVATSYNTSKLYAEDPNNLDKAAPPSLFPDSMDNVGLSGERVGLISAAFTDVVVTDKTTGKVATKLEGGQNMTIRINLDPDTDNPETGLKVKAGDQLDIMTYKPETGQWVKETSGGQTGKVTVQGVAPNLYVEFTADHFSIWNLGWARPPKCTTDRTLAFTGTASTALALTLKATKSNGGLLLSGTKLPGEASITAKNIPDPIPSTLFTITIRAYYGLTTTPVGTLTLNNWCTTTPSMRVNKPAALTEYNYTTRLTCQYGPLTPTPLPNVGVYLCPNAATSIDGTCKLVNTTGADGKAIAWASSAAPANKIFYQPVDTSGLPVKFVTAPTQGNIDWYGNWSFCPVTGGVSNY